MTLTDILLPEGSAGFSEWAKDNNCKLEDWGKEEFNIVHPHLTNKRTCVDIGAHIGLTSLRYSKHFSNVHAFEPFHHSVLQENLKRCSNVIVYPYAVDEQEGETTFYIHPLNSGGGFTAGEGTKYLFAGRYAPGGRFENIDPVTVSTKTIDSYNFKDVDFVKIDVEGNNVPVLNGMINTLRAHKPIIQIEDSTYPKTNETVFSILNQLGYTQFQSYGNPVDRFYK